jgi:hypothetical protein
MNNPVRIKARNIEPNVYIGLCGGQMIVSFLPQFVSGMGILLFLRDVLSDDLTRSPLFVGFHVPHQPFVLLGGDSFTTGERQKNVGQKELQGDDFGHEMICSDARG